MRYAAILLALSSLALRYGPEAARAQEPAAEAKAPLAAALRDARRLAECTKILDASCVVSLSDTKGYQRLNPPGFRYADSQAFFFAAMKQRGYGWTRYDVTPPKNLYLDGGRFYAFVPYVRTLHLAGQWSTTEAYEIALSSDGGETWTFVDGNNLTATQIRAIIPSYSGQPLPPTRTTKGHP